MVDENLHPALLQAIRLNELGDASPYALSYARYGSSGASFGVFQADTHTNPAARAVLKAVLEGAGVAAETGGRIVAALSRACPDGDPLAAADARAVAAALSSHAGRAEVDALDARLFAGLLPHLEACVAAAGTHGRAVEPRALLGMALWVNMTGTPDELCDWLRESDRGTVTEAALLGYLARTAYFGRHPAGLAHLKASVAAAAARLPRATAAA